MDLDTALTNRRSIRFYNNQKLSKETILQLVEAASLAPTACNRQGFRFIVIDDKNILKNLLQKGTAYFIEDVQQAILVLYDNQTENPEYQDHIQSAAAAIQNLILKATSLQIGSCWICHLPDKKYLRQLLHIPFNYDPIALVSLGYYDKEVENVKRKLTPAELVSYNKFNFKEQIPHRLNFKRAIKILGRKIYHALSFIALIKKIARKYEKKFDN